jgi:hypothetical protein
MNEEERFLGLCGKGINGEEGCVADTVGTAAVSRNAFVLYTCRGLVASSKIANCSCNEELSFDSKPALRCVAVPEGGRIVATVFTSHS